MNHVLIIVPNTASLCLGSADFSKSDYADALTRRIAEVCKNTATVEECEVLCFGVWKSEKREIRVIIEQGPPDIEPLAFAQAIAQAIQAVFVATPLWNRWVICSTIIKGSIYALPPRF
jgi:hypothetical protein